MPSERTEQSGPPEKLRKSLLLVGASRGLGAAMAGEVVERGWSVVGTVRGDGRTALHDLADRHPDQVSIESLDITDADQVASLRDRLANRTFDILFVNAGIANHDPTATFANISVEEFVQVMVTNVWGVMHSIEALQDLVRPDGLIGVMSSGQGSISNNSNGLNDLYRSSKAALNQSMRSYAARNAGDQRSKLLMAPGWIRTDLGGPSAPFGVEEAMPQVVDVLLAQQGTPGLRYLDRNGATVPW